MCKINNRLTYPRIATWFKIIRSMERTSNVLNFYLKKSYILVFNVDGS